jgi:hypothetical protein
MSVPANSDGVQSNAVAVFILAGFLVSITSIVMTWGSETMWIGHAVLGLFGFVLLVLTVVFAAAMKGRVTLVPVARAGRLHRIASLALIAIIFGSFILGLLIRMLHRDPLLGTFHGIIGLVLVVLALVQLVPAHVLRGRPHLFTVHRVTGYAIVPLFLLQIFAGFVLGES